MIRACASQSSGWRPGAIDAGSLTSSVQADTGDLAGPNSGKDVWLVRVVAKAHDGIESRYLIEVNPDSGIPTLVGVG